MNCDCGKATCTKRCRFEYGEPESCEESMNEGYASDDGLMCDSIMQIDDSSDDVNMAALSEACDLSSTDEDDVLSESSDQHDESMSKSDRILLATGYLLVHNVSKEGFNDMQRLSSTPIRYSEVAQVLKSTTTECEKVVVCFGCNATITSSRASCCAHRQSSCGLTRTERYYQVDARGMKRLFMRRKLNIFRKRQPAIEQSDDEVAERSLPGHEEEEEREHEESASMRRSSSATEDSSDSSHVGIEELSEASSAGSARPSADDQSGAKSKRKASRAEQSPSRRASASIKTISGNSRMSGMPPSTRRRMEMKK